MQVVKASGITSLGINFLRQPLHVTPSLSNTLSLSSPFAIQVRYGHARKLAVARGHLRKARMMAGYPDMPSSRFVHKEDAQSSEAICISKDERVVVCWHPETPFPYECTKPLPLDVAPTDSNLKIQALMPVKEVFRKKHRDVAVREVMKLTYTSKHRWLCPPTRMERLKKLHLEQTEEQRDREFL